MVYTLSLGKRGNCLSSKSLRAGVMWLWLRVIFFLSFSLSFNLNLQWGHFDPCVVFLCTTNDSMIMHFETTQIAFEWLFLSHDKKIIVLLIYILFVCLYCLYVSLLEGFVVSNFWAGCLSFSAAGGKPWESWTAFVCFRTSCFLTESRFVWLRDLLVLCFSSLTSCFPSQYSQNIPLPVECWY